MSIHSPEDNIQVISNLYRNYTFFAATHEFGFEYKRRGKRNSLLLKPRFYFVTKGSGKITTVYCMLRSLFKPKTYLHGQMRRS
jgi:hypothetical protein